MFFDLQRFGGKGGTTIQSTYEPTEFELKLQKLEVELTSEELVPNAKMLAHMAGDFFQNRTLDPVERIAETMHGDWLTSKELIDTAIEGLKNGNLYLTESLATLDAMTDDITLANQEWNNDIEELDSDKLTNIKNVIANDYNSFMNNLANNADDINEKMEKLPNSLSSAYDDFKNKVQDIDDNLADTSSENYRDLKSLKPTLTSALDTISDIEDVFDIAGNVSIPSDYLNNLKHNLSDISSENYKDLDSLKPTLTSALNVDFDDAVKGVDSLSTIGSYYNNLDSLIPEYNENYQYARFNDTEHSNFNNLIDGKLPSQWKTNMKDAIKTTLENTIGEVVNDLASRGVINSSVATQALYDIERNAADEVGKMYLQNIQTEGQLVENRWQVKEQSLNDQKLVLNELLGYVAQAIGLKLQAKVHDAENRRAVALALAQLFTQQFNNSINALTQQATLETQKYSALNTGINSQAQIYEQIFNNRNSELNSEFQVLSQTNNIAFNWYQALKAVADTEWTHDLSNLEQLTRMYGLRLQAIGGMAQTWEAILSNSGRKILLSSGAQEALQQPALRMWNAATGLNQSATGVLVALSNQGTRTQTQSSSGNFLGGILSAGLTAFAGGWGMGVAGAAFGQKQLT